MIDPPSSRGNRFAAVLGISLIVHVAVVLAFLVGLPDVSANVPAEETVAVEIVPEPETPREDKPEHEPEPEPEPEPEASSSQPKTERPDAPPRPDRPSSPVEPGGAPPLPFEASADIQSETPPAPVTLPDTKPEAPDADPPPPAKEPTAQEPPAQDPPAQGPPPDTADAGKPEPPSRETRSGEMRAAGAKPDVLASARGTADGGVPGGLPEPAAGVPAGQDTPSPTQAGETEADAPMTPEEQALFVPETPAVPAEKPSTTDRASTATSSPAPKAVKSLYAKDMLADPRVRGALSKLPPEKRIVQMCVIEAGEQVRHSGRLTPELLKAFGKTGGLITGTHLSARGGAVQAGRAWYDMTFECTVNADFDTITAFRFALGGAVPRAQWSARGLRLE